MDVASILKPESVRSVSGVGSKKHALEVLSDVLSSYADGLDTGQVLEGFIERERLGTTALGHSIAMPHTRFKGITDSVGAFIKLETGVDFDALDGEPVDLLFGILVPEHCTDEQIQNMKELINHLRDPALQSQLRETLDPTELYDLLTDSLTVIHKRIRA